MKLRNIISVLSAALFFATACTNDDLDRSDDSKGTKLTLSLTTKAVVTKTAAEGYEHSTPDEIKINNVAIAFFKGDERVGFQYVTFKDGIAAGNLEDGRAYYKVENMTVQGGDLKVLVLANSSLPESELQAADTPAKFKNLKETLADNGARTFDPSNLVKFGESDVEVVPGKSKEQQVELTQLAARIDLSFKVNMPDTEWNEEEYWQYTLEDLKKYGKNPDHIAGKPDSIRECKNPDDHEHVKGGVKYLEVMNRKTIIQTKTTYFFDINSVTIENVNRRSLSFLDTYNSSSYVYNTEELGVASYTIPVTDGLGSISLYSYEKGKNTETPVKVSVTGRLSQKDEKREKSAVYQNCYRWHPNNTDGSGWSDVGYFDLNSSIGSMIGDFVDKPAVITPIDLEDHTYSLELNPKESATTHTNGLVHGNLYDVVGKIDMKTYRVEYTWTLLPWNTRVREVSVDIVDPAFLVIADLEIIMPNVTSISTLFSSSSPVTISNIKTENGSQFQDTSCEITPSPGNSGTITISTDAVPHNFVPKYIYFTVTNEEGLNEDVKVTQYPPLYITNYTSKKDADAGSGQTNSNMYIFNSIIADYRGIKDPTDLNYSYRDETIAKDMAKYIREHAVLGYPETKDVSFTYVRSRKNGSTESSVYVGKAVPCTDESEDNNYRISPRFVLASQNGTNTGKNEQSSKEFCAGYIEESNNQNDFTSHQYGDWRVPTKAELLLIDVLQNTVECEVKKILEGGYYNCALPEIVEFMDPRVNKATKAVRCVRDIKE